MRPAENGTTMSSGMRQMNRMLLRVSRISASNVINEEHDERSRPHQRLNRMVAHPAVVCAWSVEIDERHDGCEEITESGSEPSRIVGVGYVLAFESRPTSAPRTDRRQQETPGWWEPPGRNRNELSRAAMPLESTL